jgi:hypothetical protein
MGGAQGPGSWSRLHGSLVICLELRNCSYFTGTMLRVFTFGILSEVPGELMSLADEFG